MTDQLRFTVELTHPDGTLRAIEPDEIALRDAAPLLAGFYNDSHNAAMMAHTAALSPEDAIEHFQTLRRAGDRPFLLFLDDTLMGDADLRHVEADRAEFAFMIGARAAQGRGLGTRFALMIGALAFRGLGLERIYASIIPANKASLRSFEKMGFRVDDSPEARRYADEEDDVTVSIERDAWELRHAEALAGMVIRRGQAR